MTESPAHSEIRTLARRVALLQKGLLVVFVAWAATAGWTFFRGPSLPTHLAVERLDIVEPDGRLAIALSNSRHVPLATLDDQVIMGDQHLDRTTPAIILFDGKGDEVGGLLFGVQERDEGFYAVRHLSLDGYKQDQTVVLFHYQNPDGARKGLLISDRPTDLTGLDAGRAIGIEPGATRAEWQAAIQALPEEGRQARIRELFGVERIGLTVNANGDGVLLLRDGSGRPRIRIRVPEEGEASLEILGAEGEVVSRLP